MPKPLTENLQTGDIHHEWLVKEYERHERGLGWYIFMITLGLGLIVYSLSTLNFLFALIIILGAIILFLQAHEEPQEVVFQIAELGIIVGTRFYPYTELGEFYIVYQPPEIKTLFMETKSPIRPTLRIPLLDQNPVEIRQTLRQYLVENIEKEEEPMSDTVARRWKIH